MQNSDVRGTNPVPSLIIQINFGETRFEPGYWHGLRQPAFVFDIRFLANQIHRSTIEKFDRLVNELLPKRDTYAHPDMVARHPLLSRLASTSLNVLAAAGMPVMAGVAALQWRTQDGVHWLFALPAISADISAPQWAIKWTTELLNALKAGHEVKSESLALQLQNLIKFCSRQAPSGVNTLRFLQAAHDEGIPWRHVANNVYQFGWGSRSRWMDSSFTDETSRISAGLVRDKMACAKILREAGLPAPAHRQVQNEDQALVAAQALGYPVVIKPADLDGGKGVFSGLQTAAAVKKAYKVASKLSKRILVEKHFEGNDYRLQIYKGEVFWVVHRRPAYVIGDGVSSIEILIQNVNEERKQPQSDPSREQGRNPILIDHEAHDWLAAQGLSLASVPADGRHVRLRGAANVSSGGTREAVLKMAHPDNLALAARAAIVMRLDLAGIDLLIPDISQSWCETGAIICEVNGQPQMAQHLHREILPQLVRRRGRIPVIVIIGGAAVAAVVRLKLNDSMSSRGIQLGWIGPDGATMGGESLSIATTDTRATCRALLADPRLDALVWHISALPKSALAIPVDHIDALALVVNSADPAHKEQMEPFFVTALRGISSVVWTINAGTLAGADLAPQSELYDRMFPLFMSHFE